MLKIYSQIEFTDLFLVKNSDSQCQEASFWLKIPILSAKKPHFSLAILSAKKPLFIKNSESQCQEASFFIKNSDSQHQEASFVNLMGIKIPILSAKRPPFH